MTAPVRVLVADDEPLARASLRRLLARHADLQLCGEARSGPETVERVRALAPDLVFLDVQMPELDGFGVLRALQPAPLPAVVFVTAYDQYAVRAFEVHALDYLLKPYTDERFEAALQRARGHLRQREAAELGRRLAGLLADTGAGAPAPANPAAPGWAQRLLVRQGTRELVVSVDELDWVEAEDYYATLHVGTASHLIRESLTALERQLDPRRFVRIHRSALVNLERVRELRRVSPTESVALLTTGAQLPISRSRREALEERLGRAR